MYIFRIKSLTSFVKRIQTNQYSENEVLSSYKDLMASELEVTKLEVQAVLSLYPENLKPLPEFDNVTGNESGIKITEKLISSFKSTMEDCQKR